MAPPPKKLNISGASFSTAPAGARRLPRGRTCAALRGFRMMTTLPQDKGELGSSPGWPPGLHVFNGFGGAPASELSKGVLYGTRALIAAVDAAARGDVDGQPRSASIPQPVRSQVHNLSAEREFVPLRVNDPTRARSDGAALLRCEHFAKYGSRHHSLTYFRGNENIPGAMEPILTALRELDVVKSLSIAGADNAAGGDALGLHWKITLNHYKSHQGAGDDREALAEAGGALFPWHTDLAANGEVTAIQTLLEPATLEFAPHADVAADTATRVTAAPGSLVLLSGPARWKWVHRAMPHPDAAGKERISLVFGCAPSFQRRSR
jgi:hypothetical protein